jgi:hypothetical protein
LCSRFACSASNRARADAGDSWKLSDGMWQSAQDRPFPPMCLRLPSLNAARPRATASQGASPQSSFVAPFPAPMATAAKESTTRLKKILSAFHGLFMGDNVPTPPGAGLRELIEFR